MEAERPAPMLKSRQQKERSGECRACFRRKEEESEEQEEQEEQHQSMEREDSLLSAGLKRQY